MNNKVSKFLLVMLLLLIFSSLLSGCGGDKKPAPSATPAPAPTVTAPAKPVASEEPLAAIMLKAKNTPGFSYDMTITGPGMNTTSKIWSMKEKMRVENQFEGKKMITIVDGDITYNYNPETNIAMKFSLKDMPGGMAEKPENPADFQDQMVKDSIQEVGKETVDGVRCRVFSYKDKDDGATAKMWLREDYGLPMRQEITAKTGEKMTIQYKNMKIGAQPADLFRLPAGAKIQDMAEIMKNMPKGKP